MKLFSIPCLTLLSIAAALTSVARADGLILPGISDVPPDQRPKALPTASDAFGDDLPETRTKTTRLAEPKETPEREPSPAARKKLFDARPKSTTTDSEAPAKSSTRDNRDAEPSSRRTSGPPPRETRSREPIAAPPERPTTPREPSRAPWGRPNPSAGPARARESAPPAQAAARPSGRDYAGRGENERTYAERNAKDRSGYDRDRNGAAAGATHQPPGGYPRNQIPAGKQVQQQQQSQQQRSTSKPRPNGYNGKSPNSRAAQPANSWRNR